MGAAIERFRRERVAKKAAEGDRREKKLSLLVDAKKRQELVTKFTGQFQQSTKKPRYKSFDSRIDAVEHAAKGTATAGYAAEVDKVFVQALKDKTGRLKDVSSNEMLYNIGTRLLTAPREGGSILERAHKSKLSADTGVTRLFGLLGENKSIKALPGYEEYKSAVVDKKTEWHYTNPLLSGAVGAITTASGIGIKKAIGQQVMNKLAKMGVQRFAGRKLLAVPNVYAKIAGAAILAVPSFATFDTVQNVIDSSDWGKAREGTWKKTAVELAGGIGVGAGTGKLALSGFKKSLAMATEKGMLSRQALKVFKKSGSTAEEAINLGFAQKREAKALAKFNSILEKDTPKIKESVFKTVKETEEVVKTRTMLEKEALEELKSKDLIEDAASAAGLKQGKKVTTQTAQTAGILSRAKTPMSAFNKAEEKVTGSFERERLRSVKEMFELKNLTKKSLNVTIDSRKTTASKFSNLSSEGTDYALRESQKIGIAAATEKAYSIESIKRTKDFASTVAKRVKENVSIQSKLTKELLVKGKLQKLEVTKLTKLVASRPEKIPFQTERERITSIKNLLKTVTVPAVGLASFGLIFPDESDAGIAKTLVKTGLKLSKPAMGVAKENLKGATEAAKLKILKQFAGSGLGARSITTETAFVTGTRMKHNALDVAKLAAGSHGNIDRAVESAGRGKIPAVIFNAFTPGSKGEFLYKAGSSPVMEIAHGQTATDFNISNALRILNNIAKKVPGLTTGNIQTSKEIVKLTEGLANKYSKDVVTYGAAKFKEEQLNKSYNKLYKLLQKAKGKSAEGKERALRNLEDDILENQKLVNSLTPKYNEYVKKATATEQALAKKYSTTRISLAVEDTPDFVHRPWLKEMLTFEEKAAVKEFRNFYDSYAIEIKGVGGRVITERPFVHHAFHPAWKEALKEGETLQLGSAIPFSKFFKRAKFSRQSVPDILYNTAKYIPDTERRLQWKSFWKKGAKLENGKVDKNTWWMHRNKTNGVVQNSDDLSKFWRGIEDATKPFADSWGNKLANKYSSFEVARLLAFIPSPGFKHAFKAIGQATSMGIGNYASHVLPAVKTAMRGKINSSIELQKLIGRKATGKEVKNLFSNMSTSMTHQGRMMNNLADLELGATINKVTMKKWDKMLESWNYYGSVPIRMVEYLDRTHTFLASLDMAAKKGMTAQQAAYGFYSTSLKNNFMSQALNPRWMRDPKIRAMMLFQQTPFKVLERRVVTALKAGKALSLATKRGKKIFKEEGLAGLLNDLKILKTSVIEGETAFKRGLIYDAIKTEKDFFGTSATKQFTREALIVGGLIYGGAKMFDLDLHPHTMHLPFLGFHGTEPSVALNPMVKAFFKTTHDRKVDYENSEEYDFFITSFLQNYLGSTNYMPSIINKAARLSDNDIPNIYDDSALKYLFAIPTKSLSNSGLY